MDVDFSEALEGLEDFFNGQRQVALLEYDERKNLVKAEHLRFRQTREVIIIVIYGL